MISFAKLKERKLVQWALAYLAGAWLLLQLTGLLAGMFGWSTSVVRFVPILLVFGFFAVLVLAWYHGEKGEQRVGTVELLMLAGILVIAGVGVGLLGGEAEAGAAGPAPPGGLTPEGVPAAVASVPEQGSIAVLPFADLSAAGDQEYFADGLTEELLNALAQLPQLRVAARTSAFAFKGTNVRIDSIARALNVRHVLEGSVRKADDQVRITAQLIDARTGYHLWSGTFDSELADIFAVQDSISRAIVQALRIELGGGREERPLVERETASPEAHTLVLRGEHAALQSTREATGQAERLFREALALDPSYARAHAGLAAVYWYQAYAHWIPSAEGYAKAERAAERALALDPDQARAHVALAQIASDRDWDWGAAEAHFALAIEANPGYARAYYWRAYLLIRLGRTEEAIVAGRRAIELDPVSFGAVVALGLVQSYAGQPERAVEQYRTALTLAPGHPITLLNLALMYSELGRRAEALESARKGVEAAPDDDFALSTLGYVQARAGRRAEAERLLAKLEALPEASTYLLATVRAGLGNRDRMFALLEQAVEEREPDVTYLGVDPVFDPYRDDPRMRPLLDRMGLP